MLLLELLKPGVDYPCGRKIPKDLPTSNKIFLVGKGASRQTGSFVVGEFPVRLPVIDCNPLVIHIASSFSIGQLEQ